MTTVGVETKTLGSVAIEEACSAKGVHCISSSSLRYSCRLVPPNKLPPTSPSVSRRFLAARIGPTHISTGASLKVSRNGASEVVHAVVSEESALGSSSGTSRCYLHSGDIDKGLNTFEEYMGSGRPPTIDLYVFMKLIRCTHITSSPTSP